MSVWYTELVKSAKVEQLILSLMLFSYPEMVLS